jgi:hypothetical protein
MVWLPMDRQIENTPTLPRIRQHNPNHSRALPLGPTPGNVNCESYKNPRTPMSTYQAEIARMPLLRNRGKLVVFARHSLECLTINFDTGASNLLNSYERNVCPKVERESR